MDEFHAYMVWTGIVGIVISLFTLGVYMNSHHGGGTDLEAGSAFLTWLFAIVVSLGLIYAAVA